MQRRRGSSQLVSSEKRVLAYMPQAAKEWMEPPRTSLPNEYDVFGGSRAC